MKLYEYLLNFTYITTNIALFIFTVITIYNNY